MLDFVFGGQNKATFLLLVEDEICSFIFQLPQLVTESPRNFGLWLAVISFVCIFVVFFSPFVNIVNTFQVFLGHTLCQEKHFVLIIYFILAFSTKKLINFFFFNRDSIDRIVMHCVLGIMSHLKLKKKNNLHKQGHENKAPFTQ